MNKTFLQTKIRSIGLWVSEDVNIGEMKGGEDYRKSSHDSRPRGATILDKINGTFGSPLQPISMMQKWRVLLFARLHHCLGGGGSELIFPFYSVQDWRNHFTQKRNRLTNALHHIQSDFKTTHEIKWQVNSPATGRLSLYSNWIPLPQDGDRGFWAYGAGDRRLLFLGVDEASAAFRLSAKSSINFWKEMRKHDMLGLFLW